MALVMFLSLLASCLTFCFCFRFLRPSRYVSLHSPYVSFFLYLSPAQSSDELYLLLNESHAQTVSILAAPAPPRRRTPSQRGSSQPATASQVTAGAMLQGSPDAQQPHATMTGHPGGSLGALVENELVQAHADIDELEDTLHRYALSASPHSARRCGRCGVLSRRLAELAVGVKDGLLVAGFFREWYRYATLEPDTHADGSGDSFASCRSGHVLGTPESSPSKAGGEIEASDAWLGEGLQPDGWRYTEGLQAQERGSWVGGAASPGFIARVVAEEDAWYAPTPKKRTGTPPSGF